MDVETIFALIDKAQSCAFDHIEIQTPQLRLSLSRNAGAANAGAAPSAVQMPPEMLSKIPPAQAPAQEDGAGGEDVVISPIAGVFYARKNPASEPYVRVGSRVEKGQPLCIVEAMKMMNEICAPRAGVIERILVAEGDVVSADDALFVLTKEG
jgi:acetyl-CoA carboxylase biotin carboxyl carrier protein